MGMDADTQIKKDLAARNKIRRDIIRKKARKITTVEQMAVLRSLRFGAEKAEEIAEATGILGPSVSRILKALSKLGTVAVNFDLYDGRVIRVTLTKTGTKELERTRAAWEGEL